MGLSKHVSKLIFLLAAVAARGADVTPGYTFTAGQSVSHVELNAAAAGTVHKTFISGQTLVTAPASNGLVVIYDGTATELRSVTIQNLVLDHAGLLKARTTETTATNNDLLLMYDVSADAYRAVTLDNLVFANTNLLVARTLSSATNWGDVSSFNLLVSSNGAYYRYTVSNLFALTNLSPMTAPTNLDALLAWDAKTMSNKSLTISNLFLGSTNAPTNLVATDVVLTGNSNGTPNKLPLAALLYPATNGYVGTNREWAKGLLVSNAHGLGRPPQDFEWRLVCLTNDAGYYSNSEVRASSFFSDLYSKAFSEWADSNYVYVVVNSTNTFYTLNGTNGNSPQTITTNYWRLKAYAK